MLELHLYDVAQAAFVRPLMMFPQHRVDPEAVESGTAGGAFYIQIFGRPRTTYLVTMGGVRRDRSYGPDGLPAGVAVVTNSDGFATLKAESLALSVRVGEELVEALSLVPVAVISMDSQEYLSSTWYFAAAPQLAVDGSKGSI